MTRPTMDVNGPEYQAILRGRGMARLYGADYKDMIWVEETMERLEKKLVYCDYTDKDRADFQKANEIHMRVFIKAGFKTDQPEHTGSGPAEGHITPQYVWHTQGDDKVRGSHAENDGEIFAWDDLPPTGHPGEDFNCRCWAEPYTMRPEEIRLQAVTSIIPASTYAWGNAELAYHYWFGNGKPLKLREIGLLQKVIDHARTYDQTEAGGGTLFKRVENQIFSEARQRGAGSFTAGFRRGQYHFGGVDWALGHVPVYGSMDVHVSARGEFLVITAKINYNFKDRMGDLANTFNEETGNTGVDLPGGTPYYVTDEWSTRLEAIIRKDRDESR